MSTGDQTQYIRGKLAQRGSYPEAKFMRDGFDEWAESETPARVGQMEKEPAERQMDNYGGAMSLKKAKKMLHLGMDDSSGRISGGIIPVPDVVNKAIDEAKKLINMWRSVSSWIELFISDLQDEIIDNPKSSPRLVDAAKKILAAINGVKAYKNILDDVASLAATVGLGRNPRNLRGGAITLADVGKYAQKIASIYGWFKVNKDVLTQILNLRSLQPYGKQFLDAVNPLFALVGLGGRRIFGVEYENCDAGMIDDGLLCRKPIKCSSSGCKGGEVIPKRRVGGRKKPSKCCCDSMHGGAFPWEGQYYAQPAMGTVSFGESAPAMGTVRLGKMSSLENMDDLSMTNMGGADPYLLPEKPTKARRSYTEEELANFELERQKREERMDAEMREKYAKKNIGGRKTRAPSARGEIVKKVMREHGLSLPQASKYVKENGLY